MLNIGGGELLIILLVALIFLGPARLPQVARQLGQTMSTLRSLAGSFQAEIEAAARPDQYNGPMHLPTESGDQAQPEADAEEPQADADAERGEAGEAPITNAIASANASPPPTDPTDVGRAARKVSASNRDVSSLKAEPEVTEGGPTDLRSDGRNGHPE